MPITLPRGRLPSRGRIPVSFKSTHPTRPFSFRGLNFRPTNSTCFLPRAKCTDLPNSTVFLPRADFRTAQLGRFPSGRRLPGPCKSTLPIRPFYFPRSLFRTDPTWPFSFRGHLGGHAHYPSARPASFPGSNSGSFSSRPVQLDRFPSARRFQIRPTRSLSFRTSISVPVQVNAANSAMFLPQVNFPD